MDQSDALHLIYLALLLAVIIALRPGRFFVEIERWRA